MPTEKRRIQLSVDEEVFRTLALDPREHGAIQVSAALARYARHLGAAAREVEGMFSRDEWNYIADVMNGCADMMDYSETPLSHRISILANVEDGHRLDGAGYKWFGEEDRAAADAAVAALAQKLHRLTDLQGDAVAAATRFFWDDSTGSIDHARDPWWTLAFRKKAAEARVRAGR
jgi:hypothetical protein